MPDSAALFLTEHPRTGIGALLARAAGTAVLVAGFFIYALALKPFAFGIWFQSEPVTIGLLVLGALAVPSLLALEWTGHLVADVLARPPVRILTAFVVWNALASALQTFPARSWFGPPEIGEGVFAFLALLLLTVLAMVLWPLRWPRAAIAAAAASSALSIGALDAVLPEGSPWRPEMFASYAGSIGPSVVLIVAGARRRVTWRWIVLGVLTGLPVVVFSANKTAILLYCVVGPVAFLAAVLLRFLRDARRTRVLIWTPIAAVVASGIALCLPLAFGWYDPLYSVRSRSLLALAAVRGLISHPTSLLWGFGWGSYNDVLFQHTFIWGVRGYRDGVWNPDWEGIGAGSFHAHYEVLQAVLGGGLVSGLLYLLLFSALVRHSRRDLIGLAAVAWFLQVGCSSFWFPYMLSFPFLGAAFAGSVVLPTAERTAPVHRVAVGRQMWAVIAMVGLAWGAWAMARDAAAGGRLLRALNRQDPAEIAMDGDLPPDHGGGGTHLWWAALSYAGFIDSRAASGHPLTEAQGLWYAHILNEVDRWTAQGRAGIRLAALTLSLRNDIIDSPDTGVMAALRARELPHWSDAVMNVLRLAPDRTDLAVPYLAWLATGKHYLPILAMCTRIASVHPNDRVCLWYSGYAQLSDPVTEATGVAEMHEALAMGVDVVVPVTRQTRAAVVGRYEALHKH